MKKLMYHRTVMDIIDFMDYCEKNNDNLHMFIFDQRFQVVNPEFTSTFTSIHTHLGIPNFIYLGNEYGYITFTGIHEIILDDFPENEWKCYDQATDEWQFMENPDSWERYVDLGPRGFYFCPQRITIVCRNKSDEHTTPFEILVDPVGVKNR